jgi:tetratricopeptide (TPR) repeat protein
VRDAVTDAPPPVGGGRRRWWALCGVGVATAAALVLLVRPWPRKDGPPTDAGTVPLPPIAPSAFLNTSPEVGYVGSAACETCHKGRHASFRCTGMGVSMAEATPEREPPDAAFDHPASKRRYQVVHKDGAMWHRELLLTAGPAEVLLEEHPIKYVVGSGENSRSYLYEADGFLMESPLTWYRSRDAWGMSPGYDKPNHLGFMRAVGESCLHCHAGRAEAVGPALHRMRIVEAAIGCERCHGPGALHVERHRLPGYERPADGIDRTIVKPSHLPRDRAEAICQQCHLPATTAVEARGRRLSEFRPGLRLQDFWHVYVPGGPANKMAVVGHFEQLHASRCYQRSETLTCITCHDPHDRQPPEKRGAAYNAICQGCHKPESCTVAPARRARESPGNDCVQCHMPRGDTDIPHHAFAHHRIGVHDAAPAADGGPPSEDVELRPFLDLSHLGDADRRRSLGLAYLALSRREKDAARTERYQRRALGLLTEAREAGIREADLDAALAQLCFDLGDDDALKYADSALGGPGLAGQARCDALLVLAREQARWGNHEKAKAALLELTRLRRNPIDRGHLAISLRALGDERGAQEALAEAVRINPRLWNLHKELAEYYRQQGDAQRAAWHQERAVP